MRRTSQTVNDRVVHHTLRQQGLDDKLAAGEARHNVYDTVTNNN